KSESRSEGKAGHDEACQEAIAHAGPTAVPEETMLEMARPVFYHRSAEFRQLLAEVLDDLQYVFQTENTVIPLTSSGTGGLEAALVNCVPQGGKVICLIAGRFGERWRSL